MRCPHCSGEIPEGSHFCGICGSHIEPGDMAYSNPPARVSRASLPPSDGGSLFDLPQAGGSRSARIFVVLALDIILAGAGIAMIVSYLSARSEAQESTQPSATDDPSARSGAEGDSTPNRGAGSVTRADEASDGSSTKAAGKRGRDTADDEPRPDKPEKPEKPDKPEKPEKPETPDTGGSAPGSGSSGPGPGPGSGSGASATGSGSGGGGAGSGSAATGSGSGSDVGPGNQPLPPLDGGAGEPTEDEVGVFASRIDGVVSRNQGSLARCYQQAAKTSSPDDPLAGRVDIRFRIMPSENVDRVRAVANTTGSDVLASCLVQHVRTWKFPNGPSAPLDFVWPFAFRPK